MPQRLFFAYRSYNEEKKLRFAITIKVYDRLDKGQWRGL